MLIELKGNYSISNMHESLNSPLFVDRVFEVLKEDGVDINYGEYISKYYCNGMIKLLKSIGIYKVCGRGDNKKIFVHPRLLIVIETTLLSNEEIAKNISKLCLGRYNNKKIDCIEADYYAMPMSMASKEVGAYSTYIIYNPSNNLYKIGKSKNVFSRFKSLRTEYSLDIIFIGYNQFDFESEIHFEYKNNRVFGEWFNIDMNDVLDIFFKYKFVDLKEKNLG